MKSLLVRSLFVLLFLLSSTTYAIKVKRTVFPLEAKAGEEIVVTVEVTKEGEEGFTKLMDSIPKGFVAQELMSNSGTFVYVEGRVKLIWLAMPEGDSFKFSYKLIYKGTDYGTKRITGVFHYVKNNERQILTVPVTKVKILKSEAPASDTPAVTSIPTKKEETTTKKEEVKTEVAVTTKKEGEVEVTDTPVKEEVKPAASAIVYKVQLGVFSKEKSSSIFGALPDVHYDRVNKLYKYYSGKFSNEADARANVGKAKKQGFKGAFIVKFKDGKRI